MTKRAEYAIAVRWFCLRIAFWMVVGMLTAQADPGSRLRLSVYTTAGDVQRYLGTQADRTQVLHTLAPLQVSRLFLEGRRGDEYVPPALLCAARDFFIAHGIDCAGGIATVPGNTFGTRQNGGLGWLNWESEKTRRDVAGFFTENAPLFRTLMIDDFYCTGDTSTASLQARGGRSWGEYRRDLLVQLIEPLILQPSRTAHPGIRLILKYPQWYDRFARFGYDPPRMSRWFDEIWVGTEVRDPRTRRMGYVQPTEGYINFRWLTSIAGSKVRGAWFDHIECNAQHVVDQAYQSVCAGARELTLFHLGDLMELHPGDAALARQLPQLRDLARRIQGRKPHGLAFYRPPSAVADGNEYLADYLAMMGLPLLPSGCPSPRAKVVFLPVQAAGDPQIHDLITTHLHRAATVIMTPACLRALGRHPGVAAGVLADAPGVPATTTRIKMGQTELVLAQPLEIDTGITVTDAHVRAWGEVAGQWIPLLTTRLSGRGRVEVFNIRTFQESDFQAAGEWLLAPQLLGWVDLPQALADQIRAPWLDPFRVRLEAPAGVGLYLYGRARLLYSFRNEPTAIRLNNKPLTLGAHQWLWVD